MDPVIVPHGGPVRLSGRVLVPSKFRATFGGDPEISIEVVVAAGQPEVRSVSVTRLDSGLTSRELRVPVLSRLLPTALAAASTSLIAGDLAPTRGGPITSGEPLGIGTIGPLVVTARLKQDLAAYQRSANLPRPGRPRHVTPPDELQSIASTYQRTGGSTSAVMSAHHLTKPTALRRIREARSAGLIPQKAGG